uniref:Uncharacterized protein n=1 Tax=Pyramimonas obovata TaxID=1411642 RepID=A0A7S0MUE6_9CHLO|mmetsp:Transcript_12759/g.26926  ORF Transcript_12759/g.26926 Transcript_12759/m.26926 type:complete len:404 (+) Transcript_12759:254-1465(+)|eukprot:CAMPEP_0118932484 /NCGR_PEP_ID=MMETSP1169-20130426/10391_1 /TAXON_ID=36882 /ORGANISM="Pyramimonas obovata, Strain CCMP722" /LENGTH=403 /DNA_ID=CAMNT_0006875153 /DNA_START=236 /DNA_END=1447 /DNA_ORIENTATION=-
MFRALGAKGGSVIAAATAAATSSATASAETRVRTQPSQVAETKFKLHQPLDEDWLAVDGEEAWPVANITNEEFEDAFQEALQLVPHNKHRGNFKPPRLSNSSSDHDSEDDDVIVLECPASSGAMELAEQSMMPDLGAPRADTDVLMRMVASCMRDPSIQRAFMQNPDFTNLLNTMKQGPEVIEPAPLGPFQLSEVPVAEPQTQMSQLAPLLTPLQTPQPTPQLTHQMTHQMTHLEGHIERLTGRIEQNRRFPLGEEPDYDEALVLALQLFSEKLADTFNGVLQKLAASCRQVWEKTAALAKLLGPKPVPRRQPSARSCAGDPRVHVRLQPAKDGLISVLMGVAEGRTTDAPSDGKAKAEARADHHEHAAHDMEGFLGGVIAFAAVVFAIVVFKRTGLRMPRAC